MCRAPVQKLDVFGGRAEVQDKKFCILFSDEFPRLSHMHRSSVVAYRAVLERKLICIGLF